MVLLVIAAVTLAGCGGKPADTDSQADGKPIDIIVSHNHPENSPEHEGMAAFKELVEEKTDGRVNVKIYTNLQLGSMREQAEATQTGTIQITQQPTAVLSTFVTAYELVDFPFLWPDAETAYKVLDGEIGELISAEAEKEGFVNLGWMAAGFKQFTANTPIHSPEDLKGMQVRVMPAPLLNAQMEAWGAKPTPIEFGELYNSLQQGVVDGQENPIKTIYLNRLFEVQSYLIKSNHGFLGYGIVANKAWFEGLPDDIQTTIRESMQEACRVEREALAQTEESMLKEIAAYGTEIIELTPEAIAEFREQVLPVHDQFAGRVGKSLLDATYAKIK
jgi:C4-dicarboxylate-binding protein DctP